MRRFGLLALVALLALGACGDDEDGDAGASQPTTSVEETTTTSAAASAAATVGVRETPLGRVLVDGAGMTLYRFTRDSAGTSACEGGCAQVWPPLAASGQPVAGDGVDGSKLSTITRADGSMQVAYGGMPLYTYAQDTAPGDTKGEGVGGVWFVVKAE